MSFIMGEEIGPIHPSRGLRQGDSLFLYLFILCVEGFSSSLHALERQGLIHRCKMAKGALIISHLLFVDDSFLFFRANLQECHQVKRCLVTPPTLPRRTKGARNYIGSLYLLFQTMVGPSLITESKYHIQRYKIKLSP